MSTARPWRPALPTDQAVGELRRESGKQFDGEVVEAFVKMLEKGDEDARAAA